MPCTLQLAVSSVILTDGVCILPQRDLGGILILGGQAARGGGRRRRMGGVVLPRPPAAVATLGGRHAGGCGAVAVAAVKGFVLVPMCLCAASLFSLDPGKCVHCTASEREEGGAGGAAGLTG